ncbi:thiamine pyrophosphate-dependent dehydrogenase E1 component subunit alpha [Aliirhizobium smilacinae]|uniref:Thiamine pyrophosphate-dependent dehydrogenase E1 component subunit alpha n=1 Tax=Aliirhizobium smilacinae TaxID=1395944 RepID=A0A5C4XDP2_9HYPH|nr:thiamine pyrophosphate-dependent dehydrogenase E1 component subunit alpha [Rhizobium smilacinae]TNM61617.1 thiamine pyrophosphate-dependent dehydrogenase E1 component subunit alpha [Rhizobium smilacinae]
MKNTPSTEDHLEIYRKMLMVRHLEVGLGALHKEGRTRGPIHRCDGQEAVGIAATAMLETEDKVATTHRGHAVYIGKGMAMRPVIAEIFGRTTGACGGRAGHMLVADAAKGVVGGNAIVGAGIPAATGMALSMQIMGKKNVAMCVFGDGAAQTGICHESMNMAALWKLPVVFVLEHNQFGLTVPSDVQSSVDDISVRAAGYGMPSEIVDGNDAIAVYRAVSGMVERARRGEGPGMIECKTYRLEGFSTSDMGGYQAPDDIAAWKARDPLIVSRNVLLADVGEAKLAEVEAQAKAEVDAAFEAALSDPMPQFAIDEACNPYSEAH